MTRSGMRRHLQRQKCSGEDRGSQGQDDNPGQVQDDGPSQDQGDSPIQVKDDDPIQVKDDDPIQVKDDDPSQDQDDGPPPKRIKLPDDELIAAAQETVMNTTKILPIGVFEYEIDPLH
ncbi:hypothetical protein BGZ99_001517 [Dissophora globulifera]|uniref:Uncharacterized protein n=1 Tax=Dissophora globulifera TaxID=979702 RepID=A0A9P6QY52_9FUNG|nr:hypothetical protein BGZ99_001517 [Dissophora globulifera]